jgi:signal transduction histidine kinase
MNNIDGLPVFSQRKKAGINLPQLELTPRITQEGLGEAQFDLQFPREQLVARLAALQARNEELTAYAHTVAHNLKNPLSVLVITSDLLTDIPDLPRNELNEYLDQIRSVAYEMNSIIDNLLLLSEARQGHVETQSLDMAAILASIRNRLGFMIKARRAHLHMPETWPVATGYAPWIEEVWANYLSNALKYGGDPPQVELGAEPWPGGMLRFWVRDHGPGIPQEAQRRLFTPFTQVGPSHSGGHGLGLAIVLQIVEKLGGQVGIESEPGHGSLFFFTLPAATGSR